MFYRIRATRSCIGMPRVIRETCEALGLNKRGKVVYKQVDPRIAGQLLKVKELINVQLVDKPLTREQERLLRRSPPGFSVLNQSQNPRVDA